MAQTVLAETLRSRRKAAGLTLEQLAAATRLSRSSVSKIEAGQTPDPGFSVVARIMAATGADASAIIDLHNAIAQSLRPRLFGVGYEGLDQEALVRRLRSERTEVLADVRLTPLSRKAGLSKTALRSRLEQEGIRYVHLPALGNPKNNREGYADPAARAPRDAFRRRLLTAESRAALSELQELGSRHVVAVLCFEARQDQCHRQEVIRAAMAAVV